MDMLKQKDHNMEKQNWTITVEEDPETGEAILPLPQEMLDKVNWKDGDTLEWIDNNDGSWSLVKVNVDQDQ